MKARRRSEARRFGGALLTAGAAVVAALGALGCVGADEMESVAAPPYDPVTFRPVSAVLERRCGTLDCHGAMPRPMRIYGQYGLRRYEPENTQNVENYAEYYSGGKEPTTLAELQDNYRAVCGLEPELLEQVFMKKADPQVLTFIRKARLLEKHKGGLLWNKGDPGDLCLTNFLIGDTDGTPCEIELGHP